MRDSLKVIKEKKISGVKYLLINSDIDYHFQQIEPLFKARSIDGEDLETGKPQGGRGKAIFFDYKSHKLITKHYYRGGLIAKILHDKYFWFGLSNTRAYREMHLLNKMQNLNLPVPKVFAAQIIKHKIFYCEDIITYRIENAVSLVEMIGQEKKEIWEKLGEVIKKFHNANIYHVDLNAYNILIAENEIYVIDFDKAKRYRGIFNSWKKKNLKRLNRSLVKLHKKNILHFDEKNWSTLIDAYNAYH